MMPFRSRHHKRYLLTAIITTIMLLVINTQLQISVFESHYSIEIKRTSTPYITRKENNSEIFEHNGTPSEQERLITYIKSLVSRGNLGGSGYNLTDDRLGDRSRGQAAQLEVYFSYKTNGYFVEIGAGDGETGSITLMLERETRWNGLLIEPDPAKYRQLAHKQRNAMLLNACVKTNNSKKWMEYSTESKPHRTPCFWIDSILQANSIDTIDVLVLDVSGEEEKILQTFPFDKFPVAFVTVELNGKMASYDSVSILMAEKGYRTVKLMSNHILDKTDVIFARNT